MLRCRDVTELVGADALARAPLRDRIGVRLHLLMCRHCRAYVRSLRLLGETARRLGKVEALPSDLRANAILEAVERRRISLQRGDAGAG